ncbi:flagellar attachment zone protein [Novymonas esmeraldas]|uniref:Flagellar attachment zone protein n=1 Tax=Novymonas esmeraldas TaxID=1808958 RepID=A0AAW0F0C4_9TRYP
MQGENGALEALCEQKDAAVADLEKYDIRANNSDKAKPQTTSAHKKVFEGEEWGVVVETKPHALHEAFIADLCAACRVGRHDLSDIAFALGSLHASVSVTHNADISAAAMAQLVEEYHYPNVWALYAARAAPKDGLDLATATIDELRRALAAQEAAVEKLADEAGAFREKRNAALEARDANGTLPVPEKPVSADAAAARALEPQQVADEPLYAATLEELQQARDAAEKLAAELEEQRAEAEKLADEVAAFREKRNAALEARDADGTLPVPEKPVSADAAAARALEPQQVADEPLYAATLEELQQARDAAEKLAAELEEQRAEADEAGRQLGDKAEESTGYLERLEDAVGLLEEARGEGEETRARAAAAEKALRDAEEENARLSAALEEARGVADALAAEVEAFREKRLAAIESRAADGRLDCSGVPTDDCEGGRTAPVSVVTIEREPLFCVKLEELAEEREMTAQMVHELEVLGDRIRDAVDGDGNVDRAGDALLEQLESLLKALEDSRDAEAAARNVAEERERELAQLRDLFCNEEERLRGDLEDAHAEVERLQGELDLVSEKLDEACRLFGDADAVNAEGVAKLEAFADVVTAARDAERAAMEELEAKENELAQLRSALEDTRDRDEVVEDLEDEVAQLQREKEITETELLAAHKEVDDLRCDLRAAEDRAAERAREVESMTLDLDALNNRIQDLLDELEEKTDQYNQVIKDLDDFARHQSREDEKELLQRLAAREQELFELQETRRGENEEHEKQVGVLQDQINRLRDQTNEDSTLHDGLQDELARLRKRLADAEAALRDKIAENEALKDDIEGMIDEHEAQMREMEHELEDKSKEVSDALERLEEMSAMVQEARESEESALRLRADSDAEVFRLQRELDKMKQLHSAMAESGDERGGLLGQVMEAEGQLRDAEAAFRKREAERDEAEQEWRDKLHKSEDLNRDLRRLLKRTMVSLSKSKDTMGTSAGALDEFRDELKPMMQ